MCTTSYFASSLDLRQVIRVFTLQVKGCGFDPCHGRFGEITILVL